MSNRLYRHPVFLGKREEGGKGGDGSRGRNSAFSNRQLLRLGRARSRGYAPLNGWMYRRLDV